MIASGDVDRGIDLIINKPQEIINDLVQIEVGRFNHQKIVHFFQEKTLDNCSVQVQSSEWPKSMFTTEFDTLYTERGNRCFNDRLVTAAEVNGVFEIGHMLYFRESNLVVGVIRSHENVRWLNALALFVLMGVIRSHKNVRWFNALALFVLIGVILFHEN
ncbi:putative orfan [Tupanvirus soda lake]|uniref:Orfan n=2 Tax=Tupanvirus TaxID=2094720 RepID=A0AC62ADE1_9VIRU|nr:putative orfan [Tupanvirus soda lake]QKU35703.1 putative orfan [Tupanvirus soda lake]